MDLSREFIELRKKYIKTVFGNLNDKQLEGVTTVKGPVLILAGAGSGKTTVLVNRIYNLVTFGDAYNSDYLERDVTNEDVKELNELILSKQSELNVYLKDILAVKPVRANNILAITFTNKAAKELKERINKKLFNGREVSYKESVNAFTFHSLCMRILRVDGNALGYTNTFTIYDTDDQKRVLKEVYKELTIDDKTLPLKYTMNLISGYKDNMLSPEDCISSEDIDYRKKLVKQVYEIYQKKLLMSNAMDFDDLIVNTVRLFSENEEILQKYQNFYKYIMVDEYQDTNNIQYKLISLLANKNKNICVVGDDDQSIYKFRGATIENILNFENQFSDSKVIKLEENYRSSGNILSTANSVISNNIKRKGKQLFTNKGDGEKVTIYTCNNEREEVDYILTKMQECIKEGNKFSDIAVLYRTNAQSNIIEQSLAKSGISYKIFGGLRFYDRKEIKDLLAYLILINNKNDDLRLKRIINEPKRGIGNTTIEKAQNIASGLGTSVFDVINEADDYDDLRKKSAPLKKFCELILNCRESLDTMSIYDVTKKLLDESLYIDNLKNMGNEGIGKIENIEEFLSNIISFERENENGTLNDFLEEISLVTTMDDYNENTDYVTLMTIHSAKGLEFKNVFLVGVEEGLFPSEMSQGDDELIEEERRLFYVAVTRAKEKLYISNSRSRMIFGQTKSARSSRFIGEIDKSFVEVKDNLISQNSESINYGSNYKNKRQIGSTLSLGSGLNNKKPSTNKINYSVNDNVKHKIFGEGIIKGTVSMGNDTLLTIEFRDGTTKKIMANFANLDKI